MDNTSYFKSKFVSATFTYHITTTVIRGPGKDYVRRIIIPATTTT